MKTCLVLATGAALLGCGGDESDYETAVNPQAASLVVSQLAGVSGGVTAGSPDATASSFLSLGSFAPNIIYPVTGDEQGQGQLGATVRGLPPLVGDCTCDPGGCSFDGCSDDLGTWTIDGTIDVAGDRYTWDLGITQQTETDSYSSSTQLGTEGDLTITATLIDGESSGAINTTMVYRDEEGDTQIQAWYDWGLHANAIELDVNRCAVAGTLDASVSAEAAANGRDVNYSGSGTVEFGPTCGTATVIAE